MVTQSGPIRNRASSRLACSPGCRSSVEALRRFGAHHHELWRVWDLAVDGLSSDLSLESQLMGSVVPARSEAFGFATAPERPLGPNAVFLAVLGTRVARLVLRRPARSCVQRQIRDRRRMQNNALRVSFERLSRIGATMASGG